MHELSFRLKRAHLRAVEVHKPLAKLFDLTPARFDVMFVIRLWGGDCLQSFIWQQLGVSPVTICKMLKAMEAKGLVWREKSLDRRQRAVGLTKYGFRCIVDAIKMFMRTERLRQVYDSMHPDGRGFVEMAVKMLRRIGRGLFDTSQHSYALHAPSAETIAEADEFNQRVLRDVERLEANRLAMKKEEERAPDWLDEILSPAYWEKVNAERHDARMAAAAAAPKAPPDDDDAP